MNSLGKLVNLEKTPTAVVAHYDSGEATIEIYKTGIIHLSVTRNVKRLKSFAVIEPPETLPEMLRVAGESIEIQMPDGTFKFDASTLTASYNSKDGAHEIDLTALEFSDTGIVSRFDIHGARNFYGLGEKTLPFNKYGAKSVMWNSDFPAYNVKFDPLYESIPFLLKSDPDGSYGLFFDNTSRNSFDVCATDSEQLVYSAAKGNFEFYLITGKDPSQIVERFSDLTGKMHMPPMWALGYQQSRWSYFPETRVLDLARGFRENGIPCDVIYLDIDYMDGYRCFTWSPKNFPTPKEMLDTLHGLGFKVVTIIDPGIKNDKGYHVFDTGVNDDAFVRKPDGSYFIGTVWPGKCVFPDFFNSNAREWWGKQYKVLLESGVDGFWNDMNEPSVFDSPNKTFDLDVVHGVDDSESGDGKSHGVLLVSHAEVHNAYGMEMARATREGLDKLESDKRPLVLTRANYAGGQRYAAMWTGDNFASWAHLRLALTMFLNIGLSGQPFVGSDVGGFIGDPSAELFTRWLELGAFSPFYRTHSVINSKPREPWAFGEPYTSINREIIDRRYQLIPEIYSAFKNAHDTGLPIVRPLFLNYPSDRNTLDISDEFMLGDKLLVAPVLDSGKVSRIVYLPEGEWLSLYDGTALGGGSHEVDAPLGKTPVFVKQGSVVFSQSLIQNTSQQADTVFCRLYGKDSGSGECYFDDGTSHEFRDGKFLDMSIEVRAEGKSEEVTFDMKGDFVPGYKFICVELPSAGHPVFHEGLLEITGGNQTFANVRDLHNGLVSVTFPFSAKLKRVVIR